MNKKNILLTIWLLLPITIVSLLMVWIFYSLDKDRLMADAVPIGAGAGDTGNANALGEWLAGRNPDAVSRALDARREGRAIDPREWPGGVEFRVRPGWFPSRTHRIFAVVDEQGDIRHIIPGFNSENKYYWVIYSQDELNSSTIYCGNGSGVVEREEMPFGKVRVIKVTDIEGNILKSVVFEPQVPDPKLQASDPMIVFPKWRNPTDEGSP